MKVKNVGSNTIRGDNRNLLAPQDLESTEEVVETRATSVSKEVLGDKRNSAESVEVENGDGWAGAVATAVGLAVAPAVSTVEMQVPRISDRSVVATQVPTLTTVQENRTTSQLESVLHELLQKLGAFSERADAGFALLVTHLREEINSKQFTIGSRRPQSSGLAKGQRRRSGGRSGDTSSSSNTNSSICTQCDKGK